MSCTITPVEYHIGTVYESEPVAFLITSQCSRAGHIYTGNVSTYINTVSIQA